MPSPPPSATARASGNDAVEMVSSFGNASRIFDADGAPGRAATTSTRRACGVFDFDPGPGHDPSDPGRDPIDVGPRSIAARSSPGPRTTASPRAGDAVAPARIVRGLGRVCAAIDPAEYPSGTRGGAAGPSTNSSASSVDAAREPTSARRGPGTETRTAARRGPPTWAAGASRRRRGRRRRGRRARGRRGPSRRSRRRFFWRGWSRWTRRFFR